MTTNGEGRRNLRDAPRAREANGAGSIPDRCKRNGIDRHLGHTPNVLVGRTFRSGSIPIVSSTHLRHGHILCGRSDPHPRRIAHKCEQPQESREMQSRLSRTPLHLTR